MADELKPVDVPKDTKVEETAPVVEAPKEETPVAAEAKPEEEVKPAETEAAAAATTEDKPAEEAKPVEEASKEAEPIQAGHLGHKAQGLSFPKNLIATKEYFFFGTDAFEPKALSAYQKSEKAPSTAHSNIAWASHTGNGLLFIGDKKAPVGIINLSDATEPEIDGAVKFHLTSKGNKHTFKAGSTAERDNWVSQLKLKIAEAKELATTVTESETYKATIESFKPKTTAVKKEEKPAEEATKTEEAAKPAEETPAAAETTPAEETTKTEEAPKAESPKPAKSKRASFFGFINKKDEAKPAETPKAEETPAEEVTKPAEEAPKAEETPKPVEETPVAETAPAEEAAKPTEEAPKTEEATPVESPKEKVNKRNSFFGSVFSKKEKKPAEAAKPAETAKPAEPAAETTETPKEAEPAPTETAPVIPPVETTTPLAVEVSSPATAPTETKTVETPAATNGEPPKETKEKRKSSLPFANFGKREKSPSPSEGEAKESPFSKLRATIKSKTSSPKAAAKPAEETPKTEEAPKEEAKPAEETPKPAEEPAKEEATPATEETKPETVATTTPAVTAAA